MAETPNSPGNDFLPEPIRLPPEKLAALYAKAKAAFSAADLQRYTEEEDGIPMEEILKQLETHQRQATRGKE